MSHKIDAPSLAAQPWSSSTFGWTGVDYIVQGGQPVYCPFSVDRRDFTVTHGWPSDAQRRELVPLFTIGAADREDSTLLATALAHQSIQEARLLDSTCEDLVPFQATYGRYAIYVLRRCSSRLAVRFGMDTQLLLRLAIVALRYQPTLLFLSVDGTDVAVLIDRLVFLGRYWLPRTSAGLVSDLHRYAACLGTVGRYAIDKLDRAPTVVEPASNEVALGYWAGPLARPSPEQRRFMQVCLNAYPSFLLSPTRPGLWTCLANDWYDHRKILREYVGLEADIQVNGKIQHGWQSGCGIDGERAYKPEAMQYRFPVFLWSQRNMRHAKADGIDWAQGIGAPFLYRDPGPDPGPVSRSLLCFPYHSVPEYPIAADWSKYGEALLQTARKLGFNATTVCLHAHDMENDTARESLRATGVEVTTVGHPLEPFFMDRLVMLIREHAAVTSDRICTAGLYAETLNRPFFVSGDALRSDPPDPDVGLGADRSWIAQEMPGFLTFTGVGHRETALRELGAEFKRDPDALRDLLYGWYL